MLNCMRSVFVALCHWPRQPTQLKLYSLIGYETNNVSHSELTHIVYTHLVIILMINILKYSWLQSMDKDGHELLFSWIL